MDLTSVLRVLTALEDSLGSLGPHVNKILARSLSLEQRREGAGRVLLEDPDCVSVLDMVKEKLHGQMMAGLLSGLCFINYLFLFIYLNVHCCFLL